MLNIEVANQQTKLSVDEARLRRAVRSILQDESFTHAQVSVAVVEDATIRRLNRQFLNRDQATDVLSFVLERSPGRLEGEVIVSAETAFWTAPRFGWSAEDELLLYLIHGTLHLAGYLDATPRQRAQMRQRERAHLAHFGLQPRYEECHEETAFSAGARSPVCPHGEKKVP